jgi:hypothetical protein
MQQYPGYYGQPNQPPPPAPVWPWIVGSLIGAGIIGVGVLALVTDRPSPDSTGPSRRSSASSPFAQARVHCSRIGASVKCSVAMSRGHGVACWETIAVCEGLERTATRCSDPLENGETASYSIEGEEFTPPLTWDMRCSSFRVGTVQFK